MQPQMPLDLAPQAAGHPALAAFHPVIQRWFSERLGEPSAPQVQGWPAIAEGHDVLIAAPTGSGKTLSAFLSALDRLFRMALAGTLTDETRVLYVSPLKALGNDVQKNLIEPLAQIEQLARASGLSPQAIRVQVRSGDTAASERAQMVKRPPHVLITTPESLYLYLTGGRSRATLKTIDTVIVDEIHALARDKRGSHLSLSLERLQALTRVRPQRVGLSATVKPLDRIAAFLTGSVDGCRRVEVGHLRPWELSIEIPDGELTAAASHEAWGQLYDRLVALSAKNRTMLIFANTRRMAERVAHDLGERIGEGLVAAHHGSMARELRLAAEEKLKAGQLKVMVATASLELGIDIGSVDLVVQVGSPRSIAVMLQRAGRAGHHKNGISRAILFATTRDELVECSALLRAVKEGTLDAVRMPEKPLDVLAQQVVAACACEDLDERRLFAQVKRAWPYRELSWEEYEQVLTMLSEGFATSRGRARTHLHRDRVHGVLRARKGARITALTNGGAIPDTFTYPVIAEPEDKQVGTLDEDFAVESMAGDVFLLGSTSWRIHSVRGGTVRVEDAKGQPPTVPFWRGEAPARTEELSHEVGRLREDVLADSGTKLLESIGLSTEATDGMVAYLRASKHALGALPSTSCIVAERFFDEAGGMQLLIHAPFGGRINRAWGLALRKRFCRTFDFELQAAASDDGILLSLGEQHSFPLADIFDFLHENTVEDVLVQAVLQAPIFGTRFRWNATRALALSRVNGGQRVPPQIQRARSDDLLAAVFPAQVGCQDNRAGDAIEVPDHPLVKETVNDCLREAMDIDGLKRVLRELKAGRIRTVAIDLPEPSPLAHALLNSAPYTYLDDAPLEERRARAVSLRRALPAEDAAAFGALDAHAIEQVVSDAAPPMRDAEELHDALLMLGVMPAHGIDERLLHPLTLSGAGGGVEGPERLASLARDVVPLRARAARLPALGLLVAAERVQVARALYPHATLVPALEPLPGDGPLELEAAARQVVRGHLEICGPVTAAELAARLSLSEELVSGALLRLESEGQVLRGTFRPGAGVQEWCDRRLLQRIHRLTVGRLRKEIEPLSAQDFMRFLFKWHHLEDGDRLRGAHGLLKAISLLQGYEAPAAAWELSLLPARMKPYLPELLERACFGGEVAFGRLTLREPKAEPGPKRGAVIEAPVRRTMPSRNANLTFVRRGELDALLSAARSDANGELPTDISHPAREVAEALKRRGASFFAELVASTKRLPAEVEDGLWELLARGLVTADALDNLRVLQSPKKRKRQRAIGRGGPGRWSLLAPLDPASADDSNLYVAKLLLNRYGIVFRELAMREPLAPPWRELLRTYRRMEARGEIRGGRFLGGQIGEQFALPEAVDVARAVRRTAKLGSRVHLAAVDPLNLTGIVTPGPRVPAQIGNYITYVDGVPLREDAVHPERSEAESKGQSSPDALAGAV
jgi:ATP-dependent Lhr-like helicase